MFLDLDGTLADSLGVARKVYDNFIFSHGATPTDAEFEQLNGPPLNIIIDRIKNNHGLRKSSSVLFNEYTKLLDKLYLEVKPQIGSREAIIHARQANWQVGVVTSNSSTRTKIWLQQTGLLELIDVLVASEHIVKGKPHPEPYLTALKRCNCQAKNSIAVEDSKQGAQAALSAGLRTFVLGPNVDNANLPEGAVGIPDFSSLDSLFQ